MWETEESRMRCSRSRDEKKGITSDEDWRQPTQREENLTKELEIR